MLGYVLKLGELLVRAAKSHQLKGRADRRNTFGQSLFECYYRLLDVLDQAESIVLLLRGLDPNRYATIDPETRQPKIPTQALDPIRRAQLRRALIVQSENMDQLQSAIEVLTGELRLLDPKLFRDFRSIVGGKKVVVMGLIKMLDDGLYVYEFDMGRWGEVEDFEQFLQIEAFSDYVFLNGTRRVREQLIADIESHGGKTSILDLSEGSLSVDVLQSAIDSSSRERSSALWSCASQLRGIILEHFTIDDVLRHSDRRQRQQEREHRHF